NEHDVQGVEVIAIAKPGEVIDEPKPHAPPIVGVGQRHQELFIPVGTAVPRFTELPFEGHSMLVFGDTRLAASGQFAALRQAGRTLGPLGAVGGTARGEAGYQPCRTEPAPRSTSLAQGPLYASGPR